MSKIDKDKTLEKSLPSLRYLVGLPNNRTTNDCEFSIVLVKLYGTGNVLFYWQCLIVLAMFNCTGNILWCW